MQIIYIQIIICLFAATTVMYKIKNGRLSAIIHLDRPDIAEYHENCSR